MKKILFVLALAAGSAFGSGWFSNVQYSTITKQYEKHISGSYFFGGDTTTWKVKISSTGEVTAGSFLGEASSATYANNSSTSVFSLNSATSTYSLTAATATFLLGNISSATWADNSGNTDLLDGYDNTDFAKLKDTQTFTGKNIFEKEKFTAYGWAYMYISANDMYAPSGGVPGAGRGYQYDTVVRYFDDTTPERVLCGFKLPDEVDLSTGVSVNLYFVMRDSQTALSGSTVVLHIVFRYIDLGEKVSKTIAETITHNLEAPVLERETAKQEYSLNTSQLIAGGWVSMEIYREADIANDNRNGDFCLYLAEIVFRRKL